jgi:hypothetical protein
MSMREQLIRLHDELSQLRYKTHRLEQERELLFFDLPRKNGLLLDQDDL